MPSIQSHFVKFWLRRLNAFSRGNYSPQEIRRHSDQVSFFSRAHKGVKIEPIVLGAVPSEWLIPAEPAQDCAILYLHGGAWMMGSANTHRSMVSRLAYGSGVRTLLINYRLAPEHPFPAGLEDCITAYDWLVVNGIAADKIIVAGDSAGGNLALALLIALREATKPLPAAAIVLSPATDLAFTGDSVRTRRHLDPIFSKGGPTIIIKDYISNHDPHEPLISPLYADLHGLPPMLIHVGDHEILLDDAVRFGEKARAAGVKATTVIWPHMFHVFQIFAPILPEANRSLAQIAAFARSTLNLPLRSKRDHQTTMSN